MSDGFIRIELQPLVLLFFPLVALIKKAGDMKVLKQKCSVHLLTFTADMSYRSPRSHTPSLISTRASTRFKSVLTGLLTLSYFLLYRLTQVCLQRHHHYCCCYCCTSINSSYITTDMNLKLDDKNWMIKRFTEPYRPI